MIDFAHARAVALSTITESAVGQAQTAHRPVIVDDGTTEHELGWIFFTESEKYLRTGKFRDRLIGNSPIFVDRADGSVIRVPTYQSAETFLAEYASRRMTHPPES